MHVVVAAIGTLKRGPELMLIDDYCQRFAAQGRQRGFQSLTVREFDTPRNLSGAKRRDAEADQLISALPAGAAIFVLDEKGKAETSKGLALSLEKIKDQSQSEAWFLIGGAEGHGTSVRDLVKAGRARTLSFGPATWPHMLVRVMICEQLYRAVTILGNHPYHKA